VSGVGDVISWRRGKKFEVTLDEQLLHMASAEDVSTVHREIMETWRRCDRKRPANFLSLAREIALGYSDFIIKKVNGTPILF